MVCYLHSPTTSRHADKQHAPSVVNCSHHSTLPPRSHHPAPIVSPPALSTSLRALPHSLKSLLSTVSFGATVRCSKNFASRQQSRALYSQPLSPSSHLRVYISQPPAQRRTKQRPAKEPQACDPDMIPLILVRPRHRAATSRGHTSPAPVPLRP